MRPPPYTIVHILDGVQVFVQERTRRESLTISTMPIAIVQGRSLHIYHGMVVFWPRCIDSCRCNHCTLLDKTLEVTQVTHVANNLWRSNKPIIHTIRSSPILRVHDPLGLDDDVDQSLSTATQKLVKAHLEYTHVLMTRTTNDSTEDPRYSDPNVFVVRTADHAILADRPTYHELLTISTDVDLTHVGVLDIPNRNTATSYSRG